MRPSRNHILRTAVLSLAIFCINSAARGQALAEHVPQDAVVYAGWAGAKNIQGFDKTHFKAVGELLPFAELFDKRLPALFADKMPAPKNDDAAALIKAIATLAWENPSALYSQGMGRDDNGDEQPSFVLLIDAGAEADAVEKDLQQRLDALVEGNAIPNLVFYRKGSVLAVGANRTAASSPLELTGPTMDAQVVILAAIKQAGGKSGDAKPASVLFLNLPNWLERARVAINEEGKAPFKLADVEKPINLKDLGPIILTARPEGENWLSDGFIPAAAPRTGFVDALFDDRPADAALLSALPGNTLTAQCYIVDLSRYLTVAKAVGDAVMPNGGARVTSALALAGMLAGASGTAVTDIFEQTGKDWVLATLPRHPSAASAAGTGGDAPDKSASEAAAALMKGAGMPVLINRPKDPAKVMASLTQMARNGVNIANARTGGRIKLTLQEEKLADGSVLFVPFPDLPNIPLAMKANLPPGVAIASSGGFLAFGINKGAVMEVLAGAAKPAADNLTESPKFKAVHAVLGAPEGARRDFVDVETLVPTSLAAVDMGLTLLATDGGADGTAMAEEVRRWIPKAEAIKPHLSPAGGASWTDATGYHFRSLAPFPAADLIGNPSGAGLGGAAVATSIALPSLNRARETANRVNSASHLKQIGMAILLYSNDHKGLYPPDLSGLVKSQVLTAEVFLNPRSGTSIPQDVKKDAGALAKWAASKGDYEFLAANVKGSEIGSDIAIAYERNLSKTLEHDGRNVLYGDGHVEFVGSADFDKLLADSKAAIDKLRQPK